MFLWIIVLFLLANICLLLIYLFLYQKEIRSMVKQLTFIMYEETNKTITLQAKPKEIKKLANQINQFMTEYRQEKIALAKAQNEFKDEVINISHDLRTPLTSIAGYVQMIESPQTSEEKKTEYYLIIRKRVEKLMNMLDEFFLFARSESDEYPLQMEKLNVGNVLKETISLYYYDFVAISQEPKIQIPSQPLFIRGDKDALNRIFQNLIQNYLKHGNGDIQISLKEAEEQVHMIFKNYAPDLTQAETERLFQRFFTADRSRNQKSTGLGLVIVDNLVKRMDGEIKAFVDRNYLNIEITFKLVKINKSL